MKKLLLIIYVFVSLYGSFAYADSYVSGYTKKDGTYVSGYTRSSPDSTNWNNYSTQGNVNPYTGYEGTKARDYSSDAQNYGSGRTIYTGPRGGQYYINDYGNKVYVPKQ
jgi:Ni/Co efflux regulator RcnB